MKGLIKKAMCMTLAVLVLGGGVACRRPDDDLRSNPNATKTLSIGYFNGGVTVEWLKELEREYEAANPDVEVLINNELKDELRDQTLMSDIKNRNEDMYFTHEINYSEYVNRGLIADVTDVVKNAAVAGEDTIENRMNENLRKFYNVDGKYYGVPFYTAVKGAVYDVDLFENKGLYLDASGNLTSGLEGANAKSVGKDGKTGVIDGVNYSLDDGLPATFEQYKNWLRMVKNNKGVTPYIWCDTDISYVMDYLQSLWAGYEGVNDFALNTTFSGTTKAGVAIDGSNAYLLRQGDQVNGRKFAVEMAKEIMEKGYYDAGCVRGTLAHTGDLSAQDYFLRSSYEGAPIAMILEGGWWENEARDLFANVEDDDAAYGKRRFAYMTVPAYDEKAEPGQTFRCTTGNIATIIRANTPNLDLAKDFLKFTLSEHAMSVFTKHIGLVRPYEYALEDGVYENLTYFSKNFYDLVTNKNTKIYYSTGSHPFRNRTNFFAAYEFAFGATINGNLEVNPITVFLNNNNLSVQDYMDGMAQRYTAEKWTTEYEKWSGV